ncbi:unnamed protein product [Macrosiphum euphorbiae]|uniref:Uncharacterized protein n=1 Tax=Macrosiphum euphorbiae TaxID=13131 RepID=A0AAV0VVG9_9HEMI|nr:unnamed protein product [Macrosiphum euphorbiae]
MLWLRVLSLKQNNSQPLTISEQDILQLIQTTAFTVPEPIFLQLRHLGNVLTTTKQHLSPAFPPLPDVAINGHGGYYDVLQPPGPNVDSTVHNLYEEIPCLGVTSETV